jgi:hypothetical protein
VEADEVCASCGIAPVDDIKLKICDGCDLVKYCSNKCQENHREQHEDDCKKRKVELEQHERECNQKMTELHDKELFEQPDESYLGECPICFLPLSIEPLKSIFHSCCCKFACDGCVYADFKSSGRNRCPFCQEPAVYGEEEHDKRIMKRVKANDPAAMSCMGGRHHAEGDYDKAFEYYAKAAELGDATAHLKLGCMYYIGEGVEKDEERGMYYFEKAAIGGHPKARHHLAIFEGTNGNIEREVKHFVIAAKLGHEESMKALWGHFSAGNISKENLEATLRTFKTAIDATKSAQRDTGEAYYRSLRTIKY